MRTAVVDAVVAVDDEGEDLCHKGWLEAAAVIRRKASKKWKGWSENQRNVGTGAAVVVDVVVCCLSVEMIGERHDETDYAMSCVFLFGLMMTVQMLRPSRLQPRWNC